MTETIPTLKSGWPTLEPGWVWLCGAGPGDPGLLTLHGLNALRQADVVVYDALVGDEILYWVGPKAELLYAGKRGGKPSPLQKDISEKLILLAKEGKRVLRLKGGDPFVFGRGGEEAQTLVKAGIPIRIIPGISAGIGGLAYAGIPVTHRDVNQTVTFMTGHDQSGETPTSINWKAVSDGSHVIVLYMAIKHLERIAQELLDAGRPKDEPVALVSSATTEDEIVYETTLSGILNDPEVKEIKPPSIICIGRAVLLRQALDWQSMMAGHPARNLDPLGLE
ncbi:MAG: uroporphyrinogen-III C-methyltransferase [Pseudomonadota bacterium]